MSEVEPSTAAFLQSRAARGSWWTLLNVGVSLPVAFVANAVVARSLGVADYGTLAVLTVVLAWVAQLTDLGVGDATVQYGSAAQARGERSAVEVLVGRGLGYRLLVQLPLLTAAVLAVLAREPVAVVAVAVASVVVPQLFGAGPQLLTIESRTDTAARFGLLANLTTQLGAVAAALLTSSAAAVWGSRALLGALTIPLILLVLTPSRRRAALRPRDPRTTAPGFWPFAVRTWLAGLLAAVVLSRSEVVLLGWWADPAAAGVFALVTGLASQVTGPVAAVVNPLVPAAAGLVATSAETVPAAFSRVLRVAGVATGGLVATALPALLPLVVPVFGADFADATTYLGVTVAASCLAVLAGPAQVFLRARGRTGLILGLTAAAALVDVVLAVVLIPWVGIWGAVVAFTATNAVLATGLIAAERRQEGVPLRAVVADLAPWALGCLAGAAAAAIPDLGSPVLAAGLGLLAGLGAYVLLVRVAGRGITGRDAAVVLDAMPGWLRPVAGLAARLVRTGD